MTTRDAILDILRRRKRTYHNLLSVSKDLIPDVAESALWKTLQELRWEGIVEVREEKNRRHDRLDFYYRLRGE